MKSIVYILIAVFIGTILTSAFPKSSLEQEQVVKIECVDESPDLNLLKESCLIIKNRLDDYGIQDFEISVDVDRKIIEISLSDKVDLNEILPLTTEKGGIEFYETFNRQDVVKLIEKEDTLFSLLNIPSGSREMDNTSAIFGYCKEQNKSQVDAYIAEHYVSKPNQGIDFVWSESANKDGDYCLHVLNHHAAMDKSQVLKSSVKYSSTTGYPELIIDFNTKGDSIWQDITRSNIGKSIALVIDGKVYCAPVVKSEIKEGKCQISGNFSTQKIGRLNAFINNDELPLVFKEK